MTITDDWDGARLSTAYAAMTAARPTPAGLEARALAALRTSSIRPRPASPLTGLHPVVSSFGALAIALIVVVALGSLARDGVAVPGGPPGASGAPSTPGSTGTAPSATPSILGIPVISLSELIARRTRSGAPSPEEVAVRGWMVRSNVVYDCALDPDPHVLVPHCLSPVFLMERPERSPGTATDGPSVVPVLGLDSHIEIDIPWQEPIEVIAFGHLGDHRWPTCLLAEQDACRRVFVADRIVSAESVARLPDPWRIPPSSSIEPSSDALEAISRLRAQLGDITVVSVGHVGAGLLSEIEPAVKDRGDIDSATQLHPVWVVRALVAADPEPGVVRTFIIADRPVEGPALPIWDASEDGVAPLPEREQSLRWPPRGADIVEMLFDDRPGRPPVHVAVIDKTGHLVEARAATSAEIAIRKLTTSTVSIVDLPDGRVLVHWGGSMCDDLLTLTISASDIGTPERVTVDGRRGSPCRMALVYYAVVLTFDPPVAAAELGGRYLIGP